MNKVKNFIVNNKSKIVGTTTTLALGVSQVAFAADSSVATSITSSFQTVVTDTLATIAAVAPIALTVFGAMFVWRKAKTFFNNMNK